VKSKNRHKKELSSTQRRWILFDHHFSRIRAIFYGIGILSLAVPIFIALIDEGRTFGQEFANILFLISASGFFLGKLMTIYDKRMKNEPISLDIGIVAGILFFGLQRLFS